MSTRFAIALLCSALAACHAGPRRAIPPEAKGAAPVRQPSIRIALGRIPTTSAYRILACSAPSTATCERTLETAIGAEVDFGPGKRAKLTQAIDVKDGAGARVRAFTVDSPLDNVGVFPAGGFAVDRSPKSASLSTDERKAMEARHRRLSPTAVWATGSAIAFESIEANLDGDGAPDRVIVSTLTQSAGKDRSMNTRIVWVSLDGATPEPVEIFAIWTPSLVGTLDFDGDRGNIECAGRFKLLVNIVGA